MTLHNEVGIAGNQVREIQDKIALLLLRRTVKHIKMHGKRLVNLFKQAFFTNLMFFSEIMSARNCETCLWDRSWLYGCVIHSKIKSWLVEMLFSSVLKIGKA